MSKKLFIAALLAGPALAFAAPQAHADIVIRVHAPGHVQERFVEYRPHTVYQRGYSQQRSRINWVNQEQSRQRDRLMQGLRSGELTRHEAEQLQREQAQIRHLEQRALADRYLSSREFAKLQEELREASRHIHAQKSDRQDRDRPRYSHARW